MVEISNIKVYDLRESVIACRNPMRVLPPEYTDAEFEKSLPRAIALAKTPSNSGHCNFLKGIRVSFDIKYPNYFTPELQRYGFIDIVSSSSKMHRLAVMTDAKHFNKYVDVMTIDIVRGYAARYNAEPTYDNFIRLVSNCPLGIELFMRISTNYMQLRNIYHQRKGHRLKDWHNFIAFIEELPYAKEFIIIPDEDFTPSKEKYGFIDE